MDLWRPDGEIIDGGSENGERGKRRKKERRRRKKGSAETLWTLRAPASLVSGGALLSTVAQPGCHVYTQGRHHS
jgi:hypothetical protein